MNFTISKNYLRIKFNQSVYIQLIVMINIQKLLYEFTIYFMLMFTVMTFESHFRGVFFTINGHNTMHRK